ncbi:MAG: cytochrome c oxidase subunit II [Verrucomicrobiota bacterium]
MENSSLFQPGSPQAEAILWLFKVTMAFMAAILLVVTSLVLYSAARFRARPGQPEPAQVAGNKRLELAWTAVPVLIVIYLTILTIRGMSLSDPAVNRPADLVVTAHQFWWEVRYPKSGVVTANEIHIPAGQKMLLRLESADVIHDFSVPKLARKMDMIPGHPNFIWLESNQPGIYLGQCAEYCGAQHAGMRFRVIAEPPEQFAAWEQAQLAPAPKPATAEAERGAELFRKMTCYNCHNIKGSGLNVQFGPDLTHLASRRSLAADVLENNRENLARWLADPQAIKPGTLMPNYRLTKEQVDDLTTYLETLK